MLDVSDDILKNMDINQLENQILISENQIQSHFKARLLWWRFRASKPGHGWIQAADGPLPQGLSLVLWEAALWWEKSTSTIFKDKQFTWLQKVYFCGDMETR
jgi:hypothetical protein